MRGRTRICVSSIQSLSLPASWKQQSTQTQPSEFDFGAGDRMAKLAGHTVFEQRWFRLAIEQFRRDSSRHGGKRSVAGNTKLSEPALRLLIHAPEKDLINGVAIRIGMSGARPLLVNLRMTLLARRRGLEVAGLHSPRRLPEHGACQQQGQYTCGKFSHRHTTPQCQVRQTLQNHVCG